MRRETENCKVFHFRLLPVILRMHFLLVLGRIRIFSGKPTSFVFLLPYFYRCEKYQKKKLIKRFWEQLVPDEQREGGRQAWIHRTSPAQIFYSVIFLNGMPSNDFTDSQLLADLWNHYFQKVYFGEFRTLPNI